MHNTGTIYSSTERSPTVLPEMAELLPPLTGEQLAALEADWQRQLDQAGWGREAVFEGVRVAADGIRAARTGSAAERVERLAEAGLTEALAMQAVVEHRELVRRIAEAAQCEADADAVL